MQPAVVSFHFGLPSDSLLRAVKRPGALILATATTVDEARWLAAHGADAIIAQGFEAGGHRGIFLSDDLSPQMGTLALLPQVVAAVPVPVIAAGGIADAAGVKAALALGASGVQVGTAYLLCPTSRPPARSTRRVDQRRRPAHRDHQHLHRPAGARRRQSPDGRAGPASRRRRRRSPPPTPPSRRCAPPPKRLASGDFSPLWAGQNTSGCRRAPAAAITRGLAGTG